MPPSPPLNIYLDVLDNPRSHPSSEPPTLEDSSTDMSHQEIALEFASLSQPGHLPTGMYLTPSSSSLATWHGVLFIHRGYYTSAIYRFLLTLPSGYPNAGVPPEVRFLSDVFHPLVEGNGSGRMDLRSRFPSWKPRQDFVVGVLHFVKGAFRRKGLEAITETAAANKEAWRLYQTQTSLFATLASQSASLSSSSSSLYDFHLNPSQSHLGISENPIRFGRLDEREYEAAWRGIVEAAGGGGGASAQKGQKELAVRRGGRGL